MTWKEFTRTEKIERISAGIIVVLTILLLIFLTCGCMMSKPKESDLPQNMSNMEKRDTFKYLSCLYAQQFNKNIDLKCGELLESMNKNSLLLNYAELKENKKLPTLYNQKGENEMTFDDYFKYVK